MEKKLLKDNSFKLVGTLKDAQVTLGTRDNGQNYILVRAYVESFINGETQDFVVNFNANELKNDKTPNKFYTTYSKLPEMVDRKVEIDGEIRGNRFWNNSKEQLQNSNILRGVFVRGTVSTTQDVATFVVSGFVASELVAKTNKDNEIYQYKIEIGQANYNDTAMSVITLNIDPERADIIRGVKEYRAGQSVRLNGSLHFITETETVTEDSAFGEGISKTYTHTYRNFFIEGGSKPITEEGVAYSNELIRSLVADYKARDVEIENKGRERGGSHQDEDTEAPKVTSRQASLI